jgi:hypothetical protein
MRSTASKCHWPVEQPSNANSMKTGFAPHKPPLFVCSKDRFRPEADVGRRELTGVYAFFTLPGMNWTPPKKNYLRAAAVGIPCAAAGLIGGLLLGETVAGIALRLGVNFTVLYLLAYLIPAFIFGWWLSPIENRLIWLPALGEALDDDRWTMAKKLYRPAPFTMCCMIGIVVGVSHRTTSPVTDYVAGILRHVL